MAGPDLSIIDVNNIERIEIIPSGGVVYGDKAVGGVINIITKSQGSSIKVEAGSYGYKSLGANINENIGDLSLNANFSEISKDGYRKNSNFKKENFGLGLAYDINENNKIKFDYAYNEGDMHYAGSLSESELKVDRTQALSTDWNTYVRVNNSDFTLNKKNQYSLTYAYDKGNLSIENNTSYYTKSSDTTYTDKSTYDIDSSFVNNNFKVKYENGNNSIITGLDISEGNSETNWSKKVTKNQLGAFIMDTYKFTDKLSLNTGYRNENVKLSFSSGKEKTYNESLVSLGTNYLYSDTGSIYISFEQNYRTPTTDEYLTSGTFLDSLKPQKNNIIELGVREYIGNTYFTGAVFSNIAKDEIYLNPKNKFAGFYGTNENIPGKTERKGLELSTKTYFGDFTISQAYTRLNAKTKDGEYAGKVIPWVPENKYSANFGYNLSNFSINAEYNYIGEMYAVSDLYNKADKIEDYSTINLKSSYKIKDINIYGGVNNLLNEKYNEYVVNDGSGYNYYPAEERNYYLGLSYEF